MTVLPWTLAPCLVVLRNQVNAIAPSRLKASDGTIGDEAHAASKSEHNPDALGVVRAIDITQDPDDHDGDPRNDFDAGKLAAQLVASRDRRILYVIWNRRIARSYPKPGIPAWTWAAYAGSDPHTNHVHLSVVPDSRANNTNPWRISATTTQEDTLPTVKELLSAPVGLNPADKKTPVDVEDRLAIASNYSFYSWQLLRAIAPKVGVDVDEKALAAEILASLTPVLRSAVTAAVTAGGSADQIADLVLSRFGDALTEGAAQ